MIVVQFYLRWVAVTWSPYGEDHLIQRKKAGHVEAKETSWESWRLNYFEKVGAHCVGCVVDDDSDVSDGGDVEESHDLPCNLSIHWNVTNTSRRTASNSVCLVIVPDFWFLLQVFAYLIFHISQLFLLDLWASSWHGNFCNTWVFYWVSDNLIRWICVKISIVFLWFYCKIFSPRVLWRLDNQKWDNRW